MERRTKSPVVVDLFCGAGGLTHGFVKEGILVSAGIDLDPECRYPFERNNDSRFVLRDVNDMSGEELRALYPPGCIKILAGCAPCQPFSSYTQGRDARKDVRWGLLHSFGRLVREIEPDIVTMENVTRLRLHAIYEDFVKVLKGLDYRVTIRVVYCPNYGIPQTRRRLVLFASKFGEIEIIPPTHDEKSYVTVRDTIGHLEPLVAGGKSKTDPLHRSSILSERNLERIRVARPGGSWRDWPDELVADCHKDEKGQKYCSVYGRMTWDEPAPTITTQSTGFGNGRFGHPEQDRAISLREAALLQTFPEDYEFIEPGKTLFFKSLNALIGNAVPVTLGRVVARSIKNHLEEVFDEGKTRT